MRKRYPHLQATGETTEPLAGPEDSQPSLATGAPNRQAPPTDTTPASTASSDPPDHRQEAPEQQPAGLDPAWERFARLYARGAVRLYEKAESR